MERRGRGRGKGEGEGEGGGGRRREGGRRIVTYVICKKTTDSAKTKSSSFFLAVDISPLDLQCDR